MSNYRTQLVPSIGSSIVLYSRNRELTNIAAQPINIAIIAKSTVVLSKRVTAPLSFLVNVNVLPV